MSAENLSISADNIEQFTAVTGADHDTAVRLLEACNGNVELAIGMHMDGTSHAVPGAPAVPGVPGAPAVPALPTDSENCAAGASAENESEDIRAPIPQRHEVLVDEQPAYGFRGRRKKARSVFDGFRDFQAETRQQELHGAGSSKKRTLEDLFRPPIDLLHRGSFHSARDISQQQNRWLLVNIQNVQEFCCQALNRDVWSNECVKKIVKQHFIFWQVYHDSEEGQRFVQFYKITKWPYIAILDPITGEQFVSWNTIEQGCFPDLVNNFLETYPSPSGSTSAESPPRKRQKSQDSIVDASEESQMAAAIAASLNAGSPSKPARTMNKQQAAAALGLLDSDDSNSDDNLETFTDSDDDDFNNSDHDLSSSKEHTPKKVPSCTVKTSPTDSKVSINGHSCSKSSVESISAGQNSGALACDNTITNNVEAIVEPIVPPVEPIVEHWEDFVGSEKDDKSDLMIRLPDGGRKQWTVSCHSKVKALTLYINKEGYSSDKFEVLLHYPRRHVADLDQSKTLKDAGLFPRETIFVQEKSL